MRSTATRSTINRSTKLVFVAGLVAWVTVALVLWLGAAPLGWDESQYAIAAQHLLEGADQRWIYLSPGMSWIASTGLAIDTSELALRFPTFVLGIVFVLVAAGLARTLCGAATAAWTTCILALWHTSRWSVELLSDLPAATCLLGATTILVVELARVDGPRWRVVFAAPLLAAAFYIRYASCVPIALVAGGLIIGFPRVALRMPVVATGALALVLLVPHFLEARAATGSALGILLESKHVPGQTAFGAGLVAYVASPFRFYGALQPILMVVGLAAIGRRDRRVTVLLLVAIANVVALGLISSTAQPRYVMFSTTILVILGVDVIRGWLAEQSRWLAGAAAATVLVAWILTVASAARQVPHRHARMAGTLLASEAIRADRRAPCHVVADRNVIIEWYSGCNSHDVKFAAVLAAEQPIYVVDDPQTSYRPHLPDFPGRPVQVVAKPGVVEVTRIDP